MLRIFREHLFCMSVSDVSGVGCATLWMGLTFSQYTEFCDVPLCFRYLWPHGRGQTLNP